MESGKGGKIVPSVVMFYESRAADNKSATGCDGSVAVGEHGASIEGMSTLIGYQAIQSTCNEMNVGNTNVDQATVKSFRRVKSFNPLAEQIGVNVLIIHYFIELKHYCIN